jgi:glutamine amidotransferase
VMVGILNLGFGNIEAFCRILNILGQSYRVMSSPRDIKDADRIILPGVGAFDPFMSALDRGGWIGALAKSVLGDRVPVLGVCIGAQVMLDRSEEGELPGLGWIRGEVKKFDFSFSPTPLPVPHIGWNTVVTDGKNPLYDSLQQPRFYFLHSYFMDIYTSGIRTSKTIYEKPFASSFISENILGVQFHPEKSHDFGITLLRNFLLKNWE